MRIAPHVCITLLMQDFLTETIKKIRNPAHWMIISVDIYNPTNIASSIILPTFKDICLKDWSKSGLWYILNKFYYLTLIIFWIYNVRETSRKKTKVKRLCDVMWRGEKGALVVPGYLKQESQHRFGQEVGCSSK